MSTPPPVHRADPPRPLADARWLAGVFILAVVLRVALHLHTRDAAYWSGDYSNYYVVAQNLLHGRGLVLEYLGPKRAFWPPVYPLFLVLGSAGGSGHWPVLLLQAAAGGGTVLCAYALCREWFDGRAARLASLGTALYPYYVSHDGSLQETGLFTFLTALSVLLLVRSWRGAAPRTATAAGGSGAAAPLRCHLQPARGGTAANHAAAAARLAGNTHRWAGRPAGDPHSGVPGLPLPAARACGSRGSGPPAGRAGGPDPRITQANAWDIVEPATVALPRSE